MKNKKGFTLIELLAVIVILGLLLAIAIPSVTKYINQSKKQTLVTSIGNYVSALILDVNNNNYSFVKDNTIYAVPIECISLERGGTNPFGEWIQANEDYFAYVLVQYDVESLSYKYGFTFKDSSGFSLTPTEQDLLNNKGEQIKKNETYKQLKTGNIHTVSKIDDWNGFDIDSNTELVVLVSELEGREGDGETTCTLKQKGSNYDKVRYQMLDKDKADSDLPVIKAVTNSATTAFWGYKDKIKNIIFENKINIPSDISNDHKWDVSSTSNGMVMAYIIENSTDSTYYDLYIQGDGRLYANKNSSYLFSGFKYVDSIKNIDILDTSKVTNMSSMFSQTGYSSEIFKLDLGNNFKTNNVTNMNSMFSQTGYLSKVFTLKLGNKFDTSKVTNMSSMFSKAGYSSEVFTLDLEDKFDTSNVTGMGAMFWATGYSSKVFTLDLGNKFNTGKVGYIGAIFLSTGYNSKVFTLDLGDEFDTSNVTNMEDMFNAAGYKSEIFTLKLGDKFDTSKVQSTRQMFMNTGYSSKVFTLDLGEKFNTSSVNNMFQMFYNAGYSSEILTLDLGNKFDTSNVTTMGSMFFRAGYKSKVFTLNLGNKFNTSNVTTMSSMFYQTGHSSSLFELDCKDWNVDKVTSYTNFCSNDKVISPSWIE